MGALAPTFGVSAAKASELATSREVMIAAGFNSVFIILQLVSRSLFDRSVAQIFKPEASAPGYTLTRALLFTDFSSASQISIDVTASWIVTTVGRFPL